MHPAWGAKTQMRCGRRWGAYWALGQRKDVQILPEVEGAGIVGSDFGEELFRGGGPEKQVREDELLGLGAGGEAAQIGPGGMRGLVVALPLGRAFLPAGFG